MNLLHANPPVGLLHRVGRDTSQHLEENGIGNLFELLCWLPDYYVDPLLLIPVERFDAKAAKANPGGKIHVIGRVRYSGECFNVKKQLRWFELHLGSAAESLLKAKWQEYDMARMEFYVRLGQWVILSGSYKRGKLQSPAVIPLGRDYPWPVTKEHAKRYPYLKGVSYFHLRRLLLYTATYYRSTLDRCIDRQEWEARGLMLPSEAFFKLHLDWPSEQIELLNQGISPAHKTVAYLRAHLKAPTPVVAN